MIKFGYDVVDGVIIGDVTFKYEFYKNGNYVTQCRMPTNNEAIAWFKENYDELFQKGVEMRIYDRN